MFSDVIYVGKHTLESERYPELLLKIIAKGGNVAKLKDDWQKEMLTSVDDAFVENFLHPCLSRRMHPIKKSSFYHG